MMMMMMMMKSYVPRMLSDKKGLFPGKVSPLGLRRRRRPSYVNQKDHKRPYRRPSLEHAN